MMDLQTFSLDLEGTTFVLQQLADLVARNDTLFTRPQACLTRPNQLSSACIPFKDPNIVMLPNEFV